MYESINGNSSSYCFRECNKLSWIGIYYCRKCNFVNTNYTSTVYFTEEENNSKFDHYVIIKCNKCKSVIHHHNYLDLYEPEFEFDSYLTSIIANNSGNFIDWKKEHQNFVFTTRSVMRSDRAHADNYMIFCWKCNDLFSKSKFSNPEKKSGLNLVVSIYTKLFHY
jgi:hypothetical protein